jgi:hypothetical protein
MWVIFAFSIISIPFLIFFDGQQFVEGEFSSITNLILKEDSKYDRGGGKGSNPSIKIKLINTERVLSITHAELSCVMVSEILSNFKKGDTIAIKIRPQDKKDFYDINFFSKLQPIYGLKKNGKEFISLDCRNKAAAKSSNAAMYASVSSAILSFIFGLFVLKPKSKRASIGQIPIDPIFIVIIIWLVVCLSLS